MATEETFLVSSIVSNKTKEGMVQIMWGSKGAQFPIEDARKIAFDILECAEAAQTDAMVVEFCLTEFGDDRVIPTLVGYFRAEREKRAQERPRK